MYSKTTVTFSAGSQGAIRDIKWTSSSEVQKKNQFEFLKNKFLTDCTISVSTGQKIYAHRVILASTSLFFKKLFTRRQAEKDPVIHLEISYMNLCLIMKYAYTGEVSMAEDRVGNFIKAAKLLEMIGLLEDWNKKSKQRKAEHPKQSETSKSLKRQLNETLEAEEPKRFRTYSSEDSDDWTSFRADINVDRKRAGAQGSSLSPRIKRTRFSSPIRHYCRFCFQPNTDHPEAHERTCDLRPGQGGFSDPREIWSTS